MQRGEYRGTRSDVVSESIYATTVSPLMSFATLIPFGALPSVAHIAWAWHSISLSSAAKVLLFGETHNSVFYV